MSRPDTQAAIDGPGVGVIRSRLVARHRYTITSKSVGGFRVLETGDQPMLRFYTGSGDLYATQVLTRQKACELLWAVRDSQRPKPRGTTLVRYQVEKEK